MTTASQELERGRSAYAERAWVDAHRGLTAAAAREPLEPADLERLGNAATLLGRDAEGLAAFERAHHAYAERGEVLRAARMAFWIGIRHARAGEMGHAGAWLGRAQRLVETFGGDCVERGYLLMPLVFRLDAQGDHEGAARTAAEAAAIASRFGDRDLFALATHQQGHILVVAGRVEEGLALLDEAMLTATEGELSPFVTGIVYCGVIMGCQAAREPRRAREWTAALARWCDVQPDMVAFTGQCLVHRAEIMQLHGAWPDALDEARRAVDRCLAANNRRAAAEAAYVQGEVLRVRGDHAGAEAAFREASEQGREPQPGLALLRLAQGRTDAAAAAIRRALAEAPDPPALSRLAPAAIEILLAAGEDGAAAEALAGLEAFGDGHPCALVAGVVAHARGSVELARGDATAALRSLRAAWRVWDELDVPYEAARTRVLIARACRALGDEDTAALELAAARGTFERLGARGDLAAIAGPGGALTARELEVLRLVAAGHTNKAVAAELVLSDRTVDRHVANIFAKLGVSSRAAATARAYELELL